MIGDVRAGSAGTFAWASVGGGAGAGLLQPGALRLDPLGVTDVRQRRAPPEGEGLVEAGQRRRRLVRRAVAACPCEETLEPVGVEGLRVDGELVARSAGHEDVG